MKDSNRLLAREQIEFLFLFRHLKEHDLLNTFINGIMKSNLIFKDGEMNRLDMKRYVISVIKPSNSVFALSYLLELIDFNDDSFKEFKKFLNYYREIYYDSFMKYYLKIVLRQV